MIKIKKIIIPALCLLIGGIFIVGFFGFRKVMQKRSQVFHEFTFALIKPDAVQAHNSGKIIDIIEQHGFTVARMKKLSLDKDEAEAFYGVHKDRSFYPELITYITSGPVIAMALEKDNAVADWRKLMGATDPQKAEQGTIRALFGTDITHNAVHGSDSADNAQKELMLFFPELM